MIDPWLHPHWQRIWQQHQAHRLPHALMLVGVPGLGKLSFAKQLGAALLCLSVNEAGEPCGVCHDCRLQAGEVHPNLYLVVPEKAGQAIKIDQVRAANEFVSQSSLKGKTRVVIFEPADQLNLNAANALLKTLEEPASDALIILVCHQAGALPATIRSRCQRLTFTVPPAEQALAWLTAQAVTSPFPLPVLLNLAGGAPRLALTLAQDQSLKIRESFYNVFFALAKKEGDVLVFAQDFQKEELSLILNLSLSLASDVMKLSLTGSDQHCMNIDRLPELKAVTKKTNLSLLSHFMAECARWHQQIGLGFQFNKTLLLESLFYRWMECAA